MSNRISMVRLYLRVNLYSLAASMCEGRVTLRGLRITLKKWQLIDSLVRADLVWELRYSLLALIKTGNGARLDHVRNAINSYEDVEYR